MMRITRERLSRSVKASSVITRKEGMFSLKMRTIKAAVAHVMRAKSSIGKASLAAITIHVFGRALTGKKIRMVVVLTQIVRRTATVVQLAIDAIVS